MRHTKILASITIACSLATSSGCATYSASHMVSDPWEDYNRAIYGFNDKLDRYALKPVAKGYKFITPDFVETGVSNFFSNIDDVTVIVNDILQGKIKQAGLDTSRLLLNTTFGIAGLFDVATPMGLPKHHEDFGQTLGKWGVAEGPYIVIPFLGPATVRSTSGAIVDFPTDPLTYVAPDWARYSLIGGEKIDTRAQLLEASNLLDTVYDPYSFLRDAYVKNRRALAYDGNFPEHSSNEFDALEESTSADDELDELDSLDGTLDELDALDELDNLDATSDELNALDELDKLDALK